jgi:lipoyl-dependent peroxiredoxin subunit D
MHALETLRGAIPEVAKDLKLNLGAVLQPGNLTLEQVWGVAVATAIASRNPQLRQAVLEDALLSVPPAVVDDAKAAAALMAMNNVYYRFRHMVGKPEYAEKPARLRMQRLAQVATSKADFELFCLAVSAINGCEACLRAHEEVVVGAGLNTDQVHDAVRIAATMHGVAVALEM